MGQAVGVAQFVDPAAEDLRGAELAPDSLAGDRIQKAAGHMARLLPGAPALPGEDAPGALDHTLLQRRGEEQSADVPRISAAAVRQR